MSFASALAVFAHPDDESFGLGAVLAALSAGGTAVSALCFTHGEASTLGGRVSLAGVRAGELEDAAGALGLGGHTLLGYPDGGLSAVPVGELAGLVATEARRRSADLLVVFDEGGITGHPDHAAATAAAVAAAADCGVPVLAWAVPARVAAALNSELGTAFVGRDDEEIDVTVTVDRAAQLRAIRCHRSQSTENPVLWRRLELMGERECLRWLVPVAGLSR